MGDGEAEAALAAHEVRHRIEDELLDVHGDGRVVQVAPHQPLVVPHVPHLAGDRHALLVLRARLAVVAEGVIGAGEHAAVQQVAADHGAGATLARLAVHRRHVAGVLRQPLLDIVAEWLDGVDLGGVVVVEGEHLHPVLELGLVVAALRAQVVDVVVVQVFLLQELDHVVDVVAVDTLDVGRRVAHGDDVVRDIWRGELRKIRRIRNRAPSKYIYIFYNSKFSDNYFMKNYFINTFCGLPKIYKVFMAC